MISSLKKWQTDVVIDTAKEIEVSQLEWNN